jgi:hypothetical protein
MLEYETKTSEVELKINGKQYNIKTKVVYTDGILNTNITVNDESSDFYMEASGIDIIEAHTALREITNTIATLTHVNFSPTPMAVAPVAAPSVGNNWTPKQ